MNPRFSGDSIVHECGDYFAIATRFGYEIYRHNGTHAERCARIGFVGAEGMRRVIAEIARRMAT